jgi:hypothetical protein
MTANVHVASRSFTKTAVLVGLTLAALTFTVPKLAVISSVPFIATLQRLALNLLTPGLVGAFIVVGNVHAAPMWIAAIGNFILYFCAAWLASAIWHRIRSARTHRVV